MTVNRRRSGALVVALVVLVVIVVLAGTWVAAGLLSDDESVARGLTFAWFVVAGALAVLLASRRRELAVPLVATWLVTSAAAGGYLLVTSSVDRVVEEDVVVAPTPAPTPAAAGASPDPPAGPVARGTGRFRDGAHPTSGTATLIERPDGSRLLTLTGFETDPGPDLRVLLVPDAAGESVAASVDLGALKGNVGNQQYAVPAGSPAGAVVIWCRAFTVSFGTASLAA